MANKKNNPPGATDDQSPQNPSRRNLLKSAGLVGTVLAGSAGVGTALSAQAQNTPAQIAPRREALENLTAAEVETLEAMVDRILPSDELGPGAREARAANYIDRSLASDNRDARELYLIGLTALDEYAVQQYGSRFHLLDAARQDQLLAALQAEQLPGFRPNSTGFFSMVRSHTIDGTFCDPYYGGNRDFIGWDMLGYPGVRVAVSESDTALGADLAPNHLSAYDMPSFTKDLISSSRGGRRGN